MWVLTLAFPFLLLGSVELILRLVNYGPDISLFTTEVIGGRAYYIMNPDVKARYFTQVEFTPTTSADYFPVRKQKGSFRIFCLGGSTTVGFPYGYAGSFPLHLRERLRRMFPDKNIEVINLGMTATNSFTALDLATELPAYDPDLIIVYDGHNEFYGALGVASRESVGQSLWLTRIYLRAIHSKLFLALRDAYTRIRGIPSSQPAEGAGTMMERLARGQEIERGSATYARALEIFRANTEDLVSVAQRHHIPILFGTQVSNLRDLPPFVSRHRPDLSANQLQTFDIAIDRGLAERRSGRHEAALSAFQEALLIDSTYARICYEIARSLDTLGRVDEAFVHYIRARDLDCLRFRASSDFNEVIRNAARTPGVFVAEIERSFLKASPQGIVGSNLILEHVHPNLRGYFLLARTYCSAMRDGGILALPDAWARRDSLSEASLWNDMRLTELDNRAAARRIAMLTSGWPFRNSTAPLPVPPAKDEIAHIVDRLTGARTSWEEAHVAAAEFYRRTSDIPNLEHEYRTLIRVLPVNVSAYLLLGDLYIRTGKAAPAAEILRRSLTIERTHYALNSLGALALDGGRSDTAIVYLREALQYAQHTKARQQTEYLIAKAYLHSGDTSAARQSLQRMLEQGPSFEPATLLMKRLEGSR